MKNRTKKKKRISITRYNKIMNNIIKIGRPVSDTLIEMLQEASQYTIKESKPKKKI